MEEKNVTFDTFTAPPFTVARFQLFYESWVAVVVRVVIFLTGALLAVSSVRPTLDPTKFSIDLPIYLWGLFILWEGIYLLKIHPLNVGIPFSSTTNLAASFSTRAAKIVLRAGAPNPEAIFNECTKLPFTKFVLTKAGIAEKDFKSSGSWGSFNDFLSSLKEVPGKEGWRYITEHDILSALANMEGPLKKTLFGLELKEEDLRGILFWASAEENERENRYRFWRNRSLVETKGIAEDWGYGYTLALDRYSRDITKELSSGRLEPYLVGRDAEMTQVEQILSRSGRKNVLLLGEAGVGKTTVIQMLALKSLRGETSPAIRYKRFLALDIAALLSGAEAGEVQDRVKQLLTDAERAGNIILVIPDIHYLAGAGEGLVKIDLTGSLMGTLEGDRTQVIATTDHIGFKKYLEPHKSFLEAFEVIEIPEATQEESLRVLEKAAPKLEDRTGISLTYGAIKSSVELSKRYMTEKELPGKAIELLDQSSVEVAAAGKKELTPTDVASIVSRKTRIPIGAAEEEEKEKLLNLEEFLHKRIVGQDQAIVAVSNAIRRARAGLRDEKRPIGVYLFLGPTGVGKTETSKALAEAYFGSEKSMIRVDMSEYQTEESQAKLIGSAGEPGNLTEALRATPFTVVLLDEIEKAHTKILDTFLQAFDAGRLTDGTGRVIDTTHAIFIATSNAGAEEIRQMILSGKDLQAEKSNLIDHLQKQGIFKPEFLNRFDEIVLYRPLSIDEVVKVVELMLRSLDKRLANRDVNLEITDEAAKKIAEAGYDPVFGARPLRRFIQDHVESVLAKKLLEGSVKRGDTITLGVNDLGDLSTEVFK